MLSPWTIAILAIVIFLFLISLAIMAAVAAGDCYGSPDYNNDSKIRSAHTSMTICACLGFAAAFVMAGIIVILAYKVTTLNTDFKTIINISKLTSRPSLEQDAKLAHSRDDIRDLHKSLTIVLIISAAVGLVASLIVGILGTVAASNLSNATKSTKVSKAYTLTIFVAILGIMSFVASIAFVSIGFVITGEEKKVGEMATDIIAQNAAKPVPQQSVVNKL